MNVFLTTAFVLALSAAGSSKIASNVPVAAAIDIPRYAFNYAISDLLTKDHKAQWEEREGDVVNGAYSLLEPNGKLRLVEYAANDLTGFNAVVKTLGTGPETLPLLEPIPLPPIKPLIDPLVYGLGAAPVGKDLPKVTVTGSSLPWDRDTGSYGGWVPIASPYRGPFATIISKKIINGKLHKIIVGPIPLAGKKLIIRKKNSR